MYMISKLTSESVSEGHPDKIADQISDAILDYIIAGDKDAKVACEVMLKNSFVIISGEITTTANLNKISHIVKNVIMEIGYDHMNWGLDYNNLQIINIISKQSSEIEKSVFCKDKKNIGAGDQGIVFGFACDDTPVLMPAPIYFANHILIKLSQQRKSGKSPWLGPDAKCQVTVEYHSGYLYRIDTIVLSTQHSNNVQYNVLKELIIKLIKNHNLIKSFLDSQTKYIINPGGTFVLGGPYSDCGLTGRKIIVDSYGSGCKHGGGAYSGKDPTKVDRSAAYMARYIAKNIVAAKLAKKCEIQIAYAIGIANPVSLNIDTYNTSTVKEDVILSAIRKVFKLKPSQIIKDLSLLDIKYKSLATYGHFGRTEYDLPWERTNKIDTLLSWI